MEFLHKINKGLLALNRRHGLFIHLASLVFWWYLLFRVIRNPAFSFDRPFPIVVWTLILLILFSTFNLIFWIYNHKSNN